MEQGNDFSYSIRLRVGNKLIGSIGLINESNRVSMGYIIAKPYWGRGLATEAVRTMLSWLRNQPQIYRVWAVTDQENKASGRVLTKAGMRREALIKNWIQFINQGNRAKDCDFYVMD